MQIGKKISKRDYILRGIIGFILLFVIWSLLTYTGVVKPFFLPSPTDTLNSIVNLFNEFNLFADILASLNRILIGFFLVIIVSIPLGILVGINQRLGSFLEPIAVFFRYIPPSAFIPLSLLWFGIGEVEKIFILFISGAPWMFFLTLDCVRNTQKELIEAGQTLGASSNQIYTKVILPNSLPGIWDAMRLIISTLWTFVIVAELIASNSGLGHVIIQSQRFLQTSNIIGVIILIGFLGLLTDLLFRLSFNKLFPWSEKER